MGRDPIESSYIILLIQTLAKKFLLPNIITLGVGTSQQMNPFLCNFIMSLFPLAYVTKEIFKIEEWKYFPYVVQY